MSIPKPIIKYTAKILRCGPWKPHKSSKKYILIVQLPLQCGRKNRISFTDITQTVHCLLKLITRILDVLSRIQIHEARFFRFDKLTLIPPHRFNYKTRERLNESEITAAPLPHGVRNNVQSEDIFKSFITTITSVSGCINAINIVWGIFSNGLFKAFWRSTRYTSYWFTWKNQTNEMIHRACLR